MRRRWLRSVLFLLAGLAVASSGLSLALRAGWARRTLLNHLSAGFGRPVDVGRFGFNLLRGLRLEAQSVTVGEDPRFGQEYFLRAERLTAGVRWTALLRGRFEFDTVSLTQPSLNLVRLADGQWNIESWLPPLRAVAGTTPIASSTVSPAETVTARISRIDVTGGRINFKRESEKLSLALVAVRGQLNQDDAGHWNVDLEADPMRAPASLQDAGTLRVRGVIGGVSARLRPADLSLTWEKASLADLSRLLTGRDYGLRGTLDANLSAKIIEGPPAQASAGDKWSVAGTVRLQGVHGWSLAGRADDPNANVNIQGFWDPAQSRLFIGRCLVETPESQVAAKIDLDWLQGFHPAAKLTSSRVALADLLAWRRAFRAGVADDLTVDGTVQAEGAVSGWPLHVENLSVGSEGAVIRFGTLPGPIRIGPISTEWNNSSLRLHPVSVLLPAPLTAARSARNSAAAAGGAVVSSSALRVEGALGPVPAVSELRDARYHLAISGAADRAQDLLALARAWGWSAGSAWSAEGPVSLQLGWTGLLRRGSSIVNGTIQARDLQLITPLVNQPLRVSSAEVELRPGLRRVDLQDVQAVGARWTGSLRSPVEGAPWDFDLSADRLDTADLNAWLGSPERPSLLRRMLPFSGTAPGGDVSRSDLVALLHASGRLRIGELVLSPLKVEDVDGEAAIDGPSLVLQLARAGFYGGQLTGTFQAGVSGEPSYSFDGRLTRVDLRDVAGAASLPGEVAGLASGDLKLTAHGLDRAALIASLQGQGQMRIGDAQLRQFEILPATAGPSEELDSGSGNLPFAATTRFQIGAGQVRFEQFQITRPNQQLEVTGSVDFARKLDLRVQILPRSVATVPSKGEASVLNVVGTLDAPRITEPAVSAARGGLPLARR